MLRLTVFFLISVCTLIVICSVGPQSAQSFATITRVTNTPEHALNLNPTLSDDGRTIIFESSADLGNTGQSASFHLLRNELSSFAEIGGTRAVCPAVSSDGRTIAFASREDLVGQNADRNSEIFLFDGVELKQLTQTKLEGNFQPSITNDGRKIAYASNGKIFLYDRLDGRFTELANGASPKISGDGSFVYYTDNEALLRIDTRTLERRVVAADVVGLEMVEGRAVSN
ncbi:MAG TPA: hypothetical protein VN659_16720, partial [Pyrinomonadaceae bacterium]|nr:hypothetical protein [Pyrinomonadaceae bacterium]